ncbi:MAG: ATP-binding protein [Bacteroidales bacterium]|nr:ATP-binding protein [Bacteroidales bacterium]
MAALLPNALPETVAAEFQADSSSEWSPDQADGRTLFDTPQAEDGTITVVFPHEKFSHWQSQALAYVESAEDGRRYLAQVVSGPYAAPVGLPATTPALVITQVEGSLFTPPYHGWASLAILGELRDGATIVPLQRPRPNSAVRLLSTEETRAALQCDGDLRLGQAVGFDQLPVGLRSTEKAHIPRHTLAVGTTGAGKSTFLAGWIEKLAAAGFCVLLLDVEGEYATIHKPADSARIVPALSALGMTPAGINGTYLLVPTHAQASDPDHPRLRRFCLEFANTSPDIAAEILGGNEAQTDRFLAAYDAAGELLTSLGLVPHAEQHAAKLRDWDDQETGYPDLKLAHVLDMAQAVSAVVGGDEVGDNYLHADGFRGYADRLTEKANITKKKLGHAASWRKTVRLISTLYRTEMFDRTGARAPDGRSIECLSFEKMIAPSRVLIYDLAGLDSPTHRNLAIADVLRGVIDAQDRLYEAAPADQKPKTVVIIEEAHEFVSAERLAQMPAVFGQIQRIARRGRKRWLGLVFATQFPQHLPGELFTLCNNRIMLRLGDEPTLRKLQHSVGGVPGPLWARLKNLPTGQAIVSAQGIEPAMIVALDPGRCQLRMVD